MYTEFEGERSVRWVRGASGTDYLCLERHVSRLRNPNEEQLRAIALRHAWSPDNE